MPRPALVSASATSSVSQVLGQGEPDHAAGGDVDHVVAKYSHSSRLGCR